MLRLSIFPYFLLFLQNQYKKKIQSQLFIKNTNFITSPPISVYALEPTLRLNGRIVGGTPADISEAPYQVAALLDWGGSGVFLQACGGSIVSENAVVTAAHCIEKYLKI